VDIGHVNCLKNTFFSWRIGLGPYLFPGLSHNLLLILRTSGTFYIAFIHHEGRSKYKKNKTKTQSAKRRTHTHTTHTCTHIQIKHESSHLITR